MRRGRVGVFFTLLGLALFVGYLVYSNPFRVLTEVGRFNPLTFLLAVGVNYIGLVMLAASWHILLRALNIPIRLWRSIQITFVSMFVVWMFPFPSAVEIIRGFLIKDETGSNHGKAVSSVLVSKVYYYIGFGVMIAVAAFIELFIKGTILPVNVSYVWFVVLFVLVNMGVFGLILQPTLLRRVYEKSPRWIKENLFDRIYGEELGLGGFNQFITEIDVSIKMLAKKPLENFLSLIFVMFHWSTGAITAFIIADSLGYRISFWVIVLIYAVIEFIQQLNILIPSGLGLVDAGLTGAFMLAGVPLASASAISLLTRLATYWLELVLCGLVSFQFGYREALRDYL